jgi:replicative DNA helicase
MNRNTPPNSEEAEIGIIGCCLLDRDKIDDCVASGVAREWFYNLRRQDLWDVICGMRSNGEHIDMVTLVAKLKTAGTLQAVGGMAALTGAVDSVPSASNLPYYINIASEMLRRRRLLELSHSAASRAYDDEDVEAALDATEAEALAIRSEFNDKSESDGKGVAVRTIELLQERCAGRDGVINTGWPYMDRALRGGLRRGQMAVFAGRPGAGKTAFAVSMMMNMASAGIPAGMFSLEMDQSEVGMRMLAACSNIDVTQFSPNAPPTEQQARALTVASARIGKMPIRVNDGPKQTARSISARARRWVGKHNVRIVFVDYLQLLSSDTKKEKDRREVVDEISRAMKAMAKELQIPVVLLAQLNRSIERDAARKPRLSDLRESGAIEQDADVVGFLYRPTDGSGQQGAADVGPSDPRDVNVLIAKQRSGPAGMDMRFIFRPEVTRFDPWAPNIEEAI